MQPPPHEVCGEINEYEREDNSLGSKENARLS